MGVEYERWLLARGNVFAPGPGAIIKLIAKLRTEGWIVDPASPDFAKLEFRGPREQLGRTSGAYAIKRIENTFAKGRDGLLAKIAASTESVPLELDPEWLKDPSRENLNLAWWVSSAVPSLKFPLTRKPEGAFSYRLEIHRAVDFVYPIAENIDSLASECRCGNDLAFEWDPDEIENPFGATTGIETECEECSRTFDPSKEEASITNPFDQSSRDVPGGCAYQFALKINCNANFINDPSLAFAPELVQLVETEFGRTFYEVGAVY